MNRRIAATLALGGGSGQTAQLGKQVPTNLRAQLADSNGCPVTGHLTSINNPPRR